MSHPTRPGAFEIPSYALALHRPLWAKKEVTPEEAHPPAAGTQAVRVTEPSRGVLYLFARPCAPGCGCTVCIGFCKWCGATLPPVEHDERDAAVIRALGRLCRGCAARQEEAR